MSELLPSQAAGRKLSPPFQKNASASRKKEPSRQRTNVINHATFSLAKLTSFGLARFGRTSYCRPGWSDSGPGHQRWETWRWASIRCNSSRAGWSGERKIPRSKVINLFMFAESRGLHHKLGAAVSDRSDGAMHSVHHLPMDGRVLAD